PSLLIFGSTYLAREDLAQLHGKLRSVALETAVGAGELGRFHAEPLRQRQPPIVGQLTARILSNRGDDANRTGLQRRKVRFIVGNRCKGVAEPEIHVPLHLRHPLTHLGSRLARWWVASSSSMTAPPLRANTKAGPLVMAASSRWASSAAVCTIRSS